MNVKQTDAIIAVGWGLMSLILMTACSTLFVESMARWDHRGLIGLSFLLDLPRLSHCLFGYTKVENITTKGGDAY